MNIKDIINNDTHELIINDRYAYCRNPWHKHNMYWFNGIIGHTLDYLADDDYYPSLHFIMRSRRSLHKIFNESPTTNNYRISNFNRRIGCGLYCFRRRSLHE